MIAVVDIAFDASMFPAGRIHPASSFPDVDADTDAGRHGTVVALLALAAAPEAQLDDVRAAGRRFVEQERTWRASAARYVPLYESLLGEKRRDTARS